MTIKAIIITIAVLFIALLFIALICYVIVSDNSDYTYDRFVDDLEQEEFLKKYRLIKTIQNKINTDTRRKIKVAREFRSHEEFKEFMKEMNDMYEDYVVDCGEQSVTSPITEVTANCRVYQINNDESTTTVAFDETGRLFTIV